MSTYKQALENAIALMNEHEDLEPKSALKWSGSEHGIAFGNDMGHFVEWAINQLGLDYS
jgi:hypothetical protein